MRTYFNYLFFKKAYRAIAIGIISVFLISCSADKDDLDTWVDNIKAKPPGRIEPMPDVKVYQPHDYSSFKERSPFAQMQPELEAQLKLLHDGCDESIRPDPNRRREELERFSLDSMEMVGTINREGTGWGLIRMTAGPNIGQVIKVLTGEYLGIHHGQINNISSQQIEISTLVPDNKGCWEKRTVFLTLADG